MIASASSWPGSQSRTTGRGAAAGARVLGRGADGRRGGARRAARSPPRSLLHVRRAVGRRHPDPPDEPGHDDDRHDVRDHEQELRRDRRAEDREAALERVGEAEDEAGEERPDRGPAAEDHRREADEPAAGRHLLLERSRSTRS